MSTLLLCGLILFTTWMTIGWIRPATPGEALRVGTLWLALTLIFEFGAGHYGFGKPWAELLADYDVRRGRIWVLVLVVTFLAPPWPPRPGAVRVSRMRQLSAGLLAVTLCLAVVGSAFAQQQASFPRWTIPGPSLTSESLAGATLPDSVRRKVGYQHWKGAAIGAAVGAALGSALAIGVAGQCADCTVTTWDRAQAALLVTGAGGVFGFLVGLASPKYVWEATVDTWGAK